MTTETGSKAVDAGTRQFDDVAAAFKQIADLVVTTTEAAREIELSTKQQSSAVEQVNVAITNAAQATKENEASSSQVLQTSSQLANLSRERFASCDEVCRTWLELASFSLVACAALVIATLTCSTAEDCCLVDSSISRAASVVVTTRSAICLNAAATSSNCRVPASTALEPVSVVI